MQRYVINLISNKAREDNKSPGTIVTLFPRLWQNNAPEAINAAPSKAVASPLPAHPYEVITAPGDPLDVFDQIFKFLNSDNYNARRYSTPRRLAYLIMDRCAANIVDSKLTPDVDYKFLEYYHQYIDELMDQQKGSLVKLYNTIHEETRAAYPSSHGRGDRSTTDSARSAHNDEAEDLGIAREVNVLKDISDIIEEVGMISSILDQQRIAIQMMAHVSRRKDGSADFDLPLPGGSVKHPVSYVMPSGLPDESSSNSSSSPGLPHLGLDQKAFEIQKLLAKADDRDETLEKLRRKALNAETSVLRLLDLKQRQDNVLANKVAEQQTIWQTPLRDKVKQSWSSPSLLSCSCH